MLWISFAAAQALRRLRQAGRQLLRNVGATRPRKVARKDVSGCVSGAFGVVARESEYAALQQLRKKVWRLPLLPPGAQQHFASSRVMSSAAAVLDSQTVVDDPQLASVVDTVQVDKILGNLRHVHTLTRARECELVPCY